MTIKPTAALTVDVVAFTVADGDLLVLLGRRTRPPFEGSWALPGALVGPAEEPDGAAVRQLIGEAGLTSAPDHLEQLATYASPGRDPRLRVASVAHLALCRQPPEPADPWAWREVGSVLAQGPTGLAFDHHRILTDGRERLRAKLEYTPLAAALAPEVFTVAELRGVYEAVWGAPLDPRNFHRKITGEHGLLTPAGQSTASGPGRPAALFRPGPLRLLNPPILRPDRRP